MLGLAGGVVEAAPPMVAGAVANGPGLGLGAQNALPRLPAGLERAVDVARDVLDAASGALGDLFGSTPDCECSSGQ